MNPESEQRKQETDQMLKWLNKNHRNLLERYKDEYVAYNAQGLIAHSENLQEVLLKANKLNQRYAIYLVPKKSCYLQILPIRFRAIVQRMDT